MGGAWVSRFTQCVITGWLALAGFASAGLPGEPEIVDAVGDTEDDFVDIHRVWMEADDRENPKELRVSMVVAGFAPRIDDDGFQCGTEFLWAGTHQFYEVEFRVFEPSGRPAFPGNTELTLGACRDGVWARVETFDQDGEYLHGGWVPWEIQGDVVEARSGPRTLTWTVPLGGELLRIPDGRNATGYELRNIRAASSSVVTAGYSSMTAYVAQDRAPDEGFGRDFVLGTSAEPTNASPPPTASAESENAPRGLAMTRLEGSAVPAADGSVQEIGVPAGILLVIVLWLLRLHLVSFFGTPLFSRIERHAALNHERRALMMDYIAANPGITFADLRRFTGIGSGALTHHLRVLERTKHVRTVRGQGSTRLYPAGVPVEPAAGSEAMRRQVLDAVREAPGIDQRTLANKLAVQRKTLAYHVSRLEEVGKIATARDGPRRRHFLRNA